MPRSPVSSHPLLTIEPVQGGCDVLIFHPRHDLTLARLPPNDVERIIEEWIRIYAVRGRQEGIKYVQIFEVGTSHIEIGQFTYGPLEQGINDGVFKSSPSWSSLVFVESSYNPLCRARITQAILYF